jgi:hypothetical protein
MFDVILRGRTCPIALARPEHLCRGISLETMTGSTRLGSCHTEAGLQNVGNILLISVGHVSGWSPRKAVELQL